MREWWDDPSGVISSYNAFSNAGCERGGLKECTTFCIRPFQWHCTARKKGASITWSALCLSTKCRSLSLSMFHATLERTLAQISPRSRSAECASSQLYARDQHLSTRWWLCSIAFGEILLCYPSFSLPQWHYIRGPSSSDSLLMLFRVDWVGPHPNKIADLHFVLRITEIWFVIELLKRRYRTQSHWLAFCCTDTALKPCLNHIDKMTLHILDSCDVVDAHYTTRLQQSSKAASISSKNHLFEPKEMVYLRNDNYCWKITFRLKFWLKNSHSIHGLIGKGPVAPAKEVSELFQDLHKVPGAIERLKSVPLHFKYLSQTSTILQNHVKLS